MRLDLLFAHRDRPSLSFEFFPPKTPAGEARLWQTIEQLATSRPDFVSVTYGAGGSTRERTKRIVVEIPKRTQLVPVAHLTCVGATASEIADLLAEYRASGIENILALRGDPPEGQKRFIPPEGGFTHATDLIRFIREQNGFAIACATYPEGHPESPNGARDDAFYLKMKQDLGACVAITQYFFDNDDYFRFCELAQSLGVTIPIVPGIMPIHRFSQIERFSKMCGATIPLWLRERFLGVDEESNDARAIAIDIAVRQCEDLLARGAPGLHFYTLNQADLSLAVLDALSLR